jgi:fluoroacetyl-CoA thioesterase
MSKLKPGLIGESTLLVQAKHTASHLGSGSGGVDVLATPIMIGLMEDAARRVVDPLMEPGKMTVGVNLNITHLAATPVGLQVTARAELTQVAGRWLTFNVEAHDDMGKIGEGTHTRAIIDVDKFMARARKKNPGPSS